MRRVFVIFLLLAGMASGRAGAADEAKVLRVVSLAPSTTDILFAIGLDKEIVGVSQHCDYPEKARTREKIGTFSDPNIEKIISLKPDIIFCTGLEQAAAVDKLRRMGLTVYVSDPVTMQELYRSINRIGELTGHKEGALRLIDRMSWDVDAIREAAKAIPRQKRPRVFIEIWHDPLMTAGKRSFIDDLITIAGGENIAHDAARPYSYFSVEEVIRRDPQCIIIGYMNKEGASALLKKRAGWGTISAVRDGHIYNDIDPDILLRPGSRSAEALKELYRRFHPS